MVFFRSVLTLALVLLLRVSSEAVGAVAVGAADAAALRYPTCSCACCVAHPHPRQGIRQLFPRPGGDGGTAAASSVAASWSCAPTFAGQEFLHKGFATCGLISKTEGSICLRTSGDVLSQSRQDQVDVSRFCYHECRPSASVSSLGGPVAGGECIPAEAPPAWQPPAAQAGAAR
eukprot:TRINITY_DN9639_c0_g4_i1.p1 TRINITY_DN9639_c0_g4~~TRINITY_DN9639_c0_g4_i1.p1  ORF type:complete len:174 (-),score=26.41 TRINITY_DN9639_c0_g4_i1:248-769(-)